MGARVVFEQWTVVPLAMGAGIMLLNPAEVGRLWVGAVLLALAYLVAYMSARELRLSK